MKLAKAARKLTITKERPKSAPPVPVPKKRKQMVDNPEETPQEPKNRVNRRDLVRRNVGGNTVGKR